MKFHSPTPDIEIPNIDIPTFLLEYSKEINVFGDDPDSIALTAENTDMTFADLDRFVYKLASGLSNNLDFKKGEVVAVVLPNCAQYPVVTMGVQMVGGACAVINPEYNARELAHHLSLAGAQYVITIDAKLPLVNDALKLIDTQIPPERVMTIDGEQTNISTIYSDEPFDRIRFTSEREATETVAFIVFSSGTTGSPKGVLVSHRNIITNILQFCAHMAADSKFSEILKRTPGKTFICALPCFHVLALVCILHLGIHVGARVVSMRRFDLDTFCMLSQTHRPCFTCVVPPVALALVKSPIAAKYDISSYVTIGVGAAPISKELQLEAQEKTGVLFTQGLGLSEASGVVTMCNVGQMYGSCGVIAPNTEAKVIDDDGNELSVGETGEICFKSPSFMIGYLNNPQATREVFDDEGFFHSGDIGYFDENGCCFITDRKKELIKYKGFQVAPAELEGILNSHPMVVDSAVIPVYKESCASEVPKAFIVVRPGKASLNVEEEIREWVDVRVAGYKKLRGGVELIDSIPKSITGKILRRILKDRESSKS